MISSASFHGCWLLSVCVSLEGDGKHWALCGAVCWYYSCMLTDGVVYLCICLLPRRYLRWQCRLKLLNKLPICTENFNDSRRIENPFLLSFLPISCPSVFCFFFVHFSRQQCPLCKIFGNFTENMMSSSLEILFLLTLAFAFILTIWPNLLLKSQNKAHLNWSFHGIIKPEFLPYLSCLN